MIRINKEMRGRYKVADALKYFLDGADSLKWLKESFRHISPCLGLAILPELSLRIANHQLLLSMYHGGQMPIDDCDSDRFEAIMQEGKSRI